MNLSTNFPEDTSPGASELDVAKTNELLNNVDQLSAKPCHDCREAICGHHVLFSVAMGFKTAVRCLGCLARGLQQEPEELRGQLLRYVRERDCYTRAWTHASSLEACSCVTALEASSQSDDQTEADSSGVSVIDTWDAGDMGCGDLVLALRIRLNKISAGGVIKVIATDPAAPEDLPAWCRMTGNRLVAMAHPEYHIERKRA